MVVYEFEDILTPLASFRCPLNDDAHCVETALVVLTVIGLFNT